MPDDGPATAPLRLPPSSGHPDHLDFTHGPAPAPPWLYLRPQSHFFVFLPGKLSTMESTRQKKVARLVQKELAEIIMHHGAGLAHGKMVSVTTVRVSPDLSLAKVWISIFPSEGSEATLSVLRNSVPRLRYELGQKVRNQLRIIPEIAFFIDDSNDYIDNISKLLKE